MKPGRNPSARHLRDSSGSDQVDWSHADADFSLPGRSCDLLSQACTGLSRSNGFTQGTNKRQKDILGRSVQASFSRTLGEHLCMIASASRDQQTPTAESLGNGWCELVGCGINLGSLGLLPLSPHDLAAWLLGLLFPVPSSECRCGSGGHGGRVVRLSRLHTHYCLFHRLGITDIAG